MTKRNKTIYGGGSLGYTQPGYVVTFQLIFITTKTMQGHRSVTYLEVIGIPLVDPELTLATCMAATMILS